MEAVLGKLVHICAQSLGELRKLIGRKGHSNRSSVAPETRENVGCGFHGLEQVHLADASARSARFAVLYGEEQRRNAERIDQSGRDDALDSFVPPFACHDKRTLTVVDGIRLRACLFGKVGLDCAAFVVDAVQLCSFRLSGLEIVRHQKLKS